MLVNGSIGSFRGERAVGNHCKVTLDKYAHGFWADMATDAHCKVPTARLQRRGKALAVETSSPLTTTNKQSSLQGTFR